MRKLAQPWLHPSLLLVADDFAPRPPSPLSNLAMLVGFIAIAIDDGHLHGEESLRLGSHLSSSGRLYVGVVAYFAASAARPQRRLCKKGSARSNNMSWAPASQ